MKTIVRMMMLVFVLALAANVSHAQSKVGYISTDSLVRMMPDWASADSLYKKRELSLTQEYQKYVAEYQKQGAECERMQKDPNASPAIKELCLNRLQDMEQTLQDFNQTAQKELSDYQTSLMIPIFDKVKKVVADVAKEKGYTYVLDNSAGVILYSLPSDDLMPDVKKKLGIK